MIDEENYKTEITFQNESNKTSVVLSSGDLMFDS